MAGIARFNELSESVSARVKPELHPGERLIWAVEVEGRTNPGWSPRKQLGCASVFLVVGILFLIAWRRATGRPGDDLSLALLGFGALIVGLGVVTAAAQSWIKRLGRKGSGFRPTYALTDRRVILWTTSTLYNARPGAIEVRSIFRGRVKSVHRIEYPDGTGDVVFDREDDEEGYYLYRIEDIPDVRRVEDLIRRTLIGPGEIEA